MYLGALLALFVAAAGAHIWDAVQFLLTGDEDRDVHSSAESCNLAFEGFDGFCMNVMGYLRSPVAYRPAGLQVYRHVGRHR